MRRNLWRARRDERIPGYLLPLFVHHQSTGGSFTTRLHILAPAGYSGFKKYYTDEAEEQERRKSKGGDKIPGEAFFPGMECLFCCKYRRKQTQLEFPYLATKGPLGCVWNLVHNVSTLLLSLPKALFLSKKFVC